MPPEAMQNIALPSVTVPQPPLDLNLSEIHLSCYAFEFLESSGWKEPCRMMTLNMGRLTFPVVKL